MRLGMEPKSTSRRRHEPAPTPEDEERMRRFQADVEADMERIKEEGRRLPPVDPAIWGTVD